VTITFPCTPVGHTGSEPGVRTLQTERRYQVELVMSLTAGDVSQADRATCTAHPNTLAICKCERCGEHACPKCVQDVRTSALCRACEQGPQSQVRDGSPSIATIFQGVVLTPRNWFASLPDGPMLSALAVALVSHTACVVSHLWREAGAVTLMSIAAACGRAPRRSRKVVDVRSLGQ
jgi:hypothetical protein